MSKTTNNVRVEDFGCRLNALEGDAVRHLLRDSKEPITIINGCAVTSEAVRQARTAARRAKRENKDARVVVTGCAAQIEASQFADMPEVDLVLGNREKRILREYENDEAQKTKMRVGDIMEASGESGESGSSVMWVSSVPQRRARAFVQVQMGCDHRCSFCVIPYGRGQSRARECKEVITECARLLEEGHKEIVLTGVDITSYAQARTPTLGALVREILHVLPDLPRLRLSSVDAVELDEDLFRVIAEEPRFMPHLHLSLQSGDDLILKRMKRRHLRKDALALYARLKALRPDMAFSADMIAGFPTESEGAFLNSCSLIEACELMHTHVFPFSPRPQTPAARMPQLARDVVKARARDMRAVAERVAQNWRAAQIGKRVQVLVEKSGFGRGEDFARITLADELAAKAELGAIVEAKITASRDDYLVGA